MGFFRRIFGAKKSHNSSAPKERRSRWSFTKSPNTKTVPPASLSNKPDVSLTPYDANLDPNKHAIAVAAATAAVAEAALAAAHAAAEVVRLTNSGGGGGSASENHVSQRRWWVAAQVAAVKIQSAFRGYLARRALRALKALVKLQALVRGHIVRKQTADMLRRMQTLVKVQARARASRAHLSESLHFSGKSALSRSTFVASPNKSEYQLRTHSSKFDGPSIFKRCGSSSTYRDIADLDKAPASSNWLDHWMAENMWNNETVSKNGNSDNENSDKILEVDTWKPHSNHHQHHILASDCYYNHKFTNSPSKFSTKSKNSIPCVSSNEVLSLSKLKFGTGDANAFTSAGNSPQVFPASYRPGGSGRRGPCTPTRSECNWSALSGYSGYPNYMANTESSRAKVRSQSAPRQRLDFDRYGSTRRYGQGIWEWGNVSYSERDFGQDIVSSRNKGFPVSERLSRVGSSKLR